MNPIFDDIRSRIIALDNPEAAKAPGMVYQLWEDGEITLQKSGPLLWQRNLHTLSFPIKGLDLQLPHNTRSGHSYVWLENDPGPLYDELLTLARSAGMEPWWPAGEAQQ